jgi:hypothetical protein
MYPNTKDKIASYGRVPPHKKQSKKTQTVQEVIEMYEGI